MNLLLHVHCITLVDVCGKQMTGIAPGLVYGVSMEAMM